MEQEQRIATLERLLAEQATKAARPSISQNVTALAVLRRISLRWRSAAIARSLDGWAGAAAEATSFFAKVITVVLLCFDLHDIMIFNKQFCTPIHSESRIEAH